MLFPGAHFWMDIGHQNCCLPCKTPYIVLGFHAASNYSSTTLSPMPFSIPRLRRWFAGGAILVCLAVLGTFFYLKHRVQNGIKQIPGKLNVEYSQSTQQFT